jgi:protein-S-isoprenylcysteine O-methyltransferase Ste14
MFLRWLQAVLLLPGTVLVAVPAAILHYSAPSLRDVMAEPGSTRFVLALVVAVPGLILAAWTMSLFIRFGDGTAAPWDPPQKLVIRGPYRHVRNPMISGVLFLLIAESMFFDVSGLLVWTTVFFVGNSVYFPLVEEPGLRKRFGDDYKIYFRNVGRWIPRLTPWSPTEDC